MLDFDKDKMIEEFAEELDDVFAEELADLLDNKIVLYDEDGEAVEFEFLELIEYEDKEYVVLFPLDQEDNTGGVAILQVAESDSEDTEAYESVEDEKTLMAVYNIFKEKFKHEFNFLD